MLRAPIFMKLTSMVVHKPYKGKEEELIPAIKASYRDLYKTGYVTAQAPRLIRTSGNSIIIIFEWNSRETREASQFHPVVQSHWMKLSKLCEFDKASNLTEFQNPFPAFENIEWKDWDQ